jgi:hypothetical protein
MQAVVDNLLHLALHFLRRRYAMRHYAAARDAKKAIPLLSPL